LPLVAPGFLPRRIVQRRAQREVLHGKRRHHGVMRFHDGRANDKGIRIEQTRRQTHWRHVQVKINQRNGLEPSLAVQVHETDLLIAILARQARVTEAFVTFQRVARGGLSNDDGPAKARREVFDDPPQRVGVRGGELIHRVHDVRLDDDVLFLPQFRQDLIIDSSQGRGNILAAVVTLRDRDWRNAREFLHDRRDGEGGRGLRAQPAGRRKDKAGSRSLQESPARENHWIYTSTRPMITPLEGYDRRQLFKEGYR